MLYYALIFLIIAAAAAVFGFGGVAVAVAGVAKIIFMIFLISFFLTLVLYLGRRV